MSQTPITDATPHNVGRELLAEVEKLRATILCEQGNLLEVNDSRDALLAEAERLRDSVQYWRDKSEERLRTVESAGVELNKLRRKVAAAEGMAEACEDFKSECQDCGGAGYYVVGSGDAPEQVQCQRCFGLLAALTAWQEANKPERENTHDAKFALTKRADVPPWQEAAK
jgi:hypothetical protein